MRRNGRLNQPQPGPRESSGTEMKPRTGNAAGPAGRQPHGAPAPAPAPAPTARDRGDATPASPSDSTVVELLDSRSRGVSEVFESPAVAGGASTGNRATPAASYPAPAAVAPEVASHVENPSALSQDARHWFEPNTYPIVGISPDELAPLGHEDVYFSTSVFIWEFLLNTFPFPLALVLLLRSGCAAVRVRGFWGVYSAYSVAGYLVYIALAVMDVLWAKYGSELQHISTPELVVVNVAFLVRNAIVATKYAYFTSAERDQLVHPSTSMADVGEKLVIAGWLVPSRRVIQRELVYATRRLEVPIDNLAFTFRDSAEEQRRSLAYGRRKMRTKQPRAQAFSHQELAARLRDLVNQQQCSCTAGDKSDAGWRAWSHWMEMAQGGKFAASLLVTMVLEDAVRQYPGEPFGQLSWVLAVVHAAIIPVTRVWDSNPAFGSTWQEVTISICAGFISIYMLRANLGYVLTGLRDYQRRLYSMRQCSAMIDSTLKMRFCSRSSLLKALPQIDLDSPENLFAWTHFRRIIKDWGLQFFVRLTAYGGLLLVVVFSLWVVLAVQLFSAPDTVNSSSIVLAIFDLILVFVLLGGMVNAGKELNRQHASHSMILVKHQVAIQQEIHLCSQARSFFAAASEPQHSSGSSDLGKQAGGQGQASLTRATRVPSSYARKLVQRAKHVPAVISEALKLREQQHQHRQRSPSAEQQQSTGAAAAIDGGQAAVPVDGDGESQSSDFATHADFRARPEPQNAAESAVAVDSQLAADALHDTAEQLEAAWRAFLTSELQTSHHTIDTVIKLLEIDDRENPIRILGLRADNNFTRGLASVAAASVGIGLRVLLL